MKAKFKPLIILIAVFIVTLASGIAAGCSIGEKTPRQLADEKGLTCPVTYYANGGNFLLGENKVTSAYRTVYYKPGTPIFNIGDVDVKTSSQTNLSIGYEGFVFKGWYYCVLDDEQHPILKDEAGNPLKYYDNGSADITKVEEGIEIQVTESEKKFNAEIDRSKGRVFEKLEGGGYKPVFAEEGKHLFLIADWERDVEIEYKLVTDEPMTVTVGETTETWESGKTIGYKSFALDPTISLNPEDSLGVATTSHTYISLYFDEACTDPVIAGSERARIPKPEDGNNKIIYAKYLKGTSWVPVRNSADVVNLFSSIEIDKRYFVVNDIDCGGAAVDSKNDKLNTASIDGNNKTISNIKVKPGTTLSKDTKVSLFGKLAVNTEMKNLTLKNIEFDTVAIRAGFNLSVFVFMSEFETPAAGSSDKTATFENVVIDGVKVTINTNSTGIIDNIPLIGADYGTDRWLYCNGYSDEDFAKTYGVTVKNAELIIDEKTIIPGGHNE